MAKQISRRTILKAAAASAVVGAVPIRSWAAESAKIGVILPTSGVFAFPGQQSRKGIEYAALVNKERNGPNMEFIFADTESKPENGRVAAEKLIRQGCTALIGAWDTGATISAAQAVETAKVPLLINIGSAPQITEQGFTQIFRNFASVSSMIASAVTRIHELVTTQKVMPKSAVVLYVNDTFGQSALASLDAIWEKAKVPIKIVDKIGYDVRAKDLSVEVAKAKATGAELVLPITRTNDAIMIVREMVKQKYNPMAIIGPGSPGPYERAFTDALGKFGDDYMICVPWWNPRNPRAKVIAERYEKMEKGNRFELNVGFSFEAVEVMADAVKRAKSNDPAAIHAALKTTNIEDHIMYGGPIRFDEKGQNPNIGVALLQNRDGVPTVVGPQQITMAAPAFPMRPFAGR
ncbi:branched-chain amino acid ABC transporter substrate-binding protein [Noviherbaspirillum cavernae]|uniref:Branched-chain amino acid ABC transporter substrate-binding protein n=1 Tax=Noviherbaspirillum cavernae TaxID=2320862 RepID=A0A418WWC8_9BURK|nr:ABC transporter substrate-binding protein [Noviherbaspirillum cavernae]RJF96948.1 branched-chain amino acid ABC transporter substrate-binding protein [Noviherbaspirillum cavernae]